MRSTQKIITTFLFTSAFATSFLLAQATRTPPTPATLAQQRVNRLTKLLTLTTAQQGQALTIFTNELTANATPEASIKTTRQNLAAAVQANNTGEISTDSGEIGTLTGQLVLSEASANAAFYLILTPAQQTQYNNLHEMGMGGGAGGGMRGFGRGARN
jgi:Spy/CpxP family protein refolding chaperone